MHVSIVIPAYNEERLLPATLEVVRVAAEAAFTTRDWEWEIVVCDNNSSDRTGEIAREAGAKVIFEPINQIGRARDTGAQAACGTWLIFIDADSTPNAGLFADIAEQIVVGRAIGGGVTVCLDSDAPWHARLLGICWNSWSRLVCWAAGSCVGLRLRRFAKLEALAPRPMQARKLG